MRSIFFGDGGGESTKAIFFKKDFVDGIAISVQFRMT